MPANDRIALVIGNSAYTGSTPLPNAVNDAALITRRLLLLGFNVVGGATSPHVDTGRTAGMNLTALPMLALIGDFMTHVEPGATVVVYYAGHGLQVGGKNYLVPVDDTLDANLPNLGLVEIKPRLETLADKVGSTGTVVVFLDACRDDPVTPEQRKRLLNLLDPPMAQPEFGQDRPDTSRTRGGLATVKMTQNPRCGRTFIGFATAPGDVAFDGPKNSHNSPFATALDDHLATRGLEIEALYNRVQCDVQDTVAEMRRYQDPWSESNLDRELYLYPRHGLPIFALAIGGALAGLAICLAVFNNGRLVKPAPWWSWALGLLFGLVAAFGTWAWGARRARNILLAFVGPGIGFALAFAIMQIVPELPQNMAGSEPVGARAAARDIYFWVTVAGGAIYLLGTLAVRLEKNLPWSETPLGWLNWCLTWGLPFIIIAVLLRLDFYIAATNPFFTTIAMFAVLGGVIYATSVSLACRAQGGNFSQFGPFTGAITVGLLMAAFFAFFIVIGDRRSIMTADANWLMVMLGTAWHGLLGAQLGYCFTYYVPDHRRRRR